MKTGIRHGVIALVVSSASIIPATAQTPAEPPVKTFRSATDLVSIQASVRDKRGRPLNSLKTTDFEVLDNGQVRPILSLRADRLSPVSLAILVDMSGSMAVASKMEMARQAYATLLSQLRDGQDEVAVFTFDSALHQRQRVHEQPWQHSIRARRVQPVRHYVALRRHRGHGTARCEPLRDAQGDHHPDRRHRYQQLAVGTAGFGPREARLMCRFMSWRPSGDGRDGYQGSGRTADAIGWRRPARSRGVDWRTALFSSSFEETATVATRLLDELRQRYVLAIEAASVYEWRRLEVRVKHPRPSSRHAADISAGGYRRSG